MRTQYTDLNIRFSIENAELLASNIVFERFSRHIPRHSHGQSSYEIHYIPYGQGTVIADGTPYPVSPDTLYVTGPHVEHEQISDAVNPMAEYCIYFIIAKNEKPASSPLLQLLESRSFWFGTDTQNLHDTMRMIFSELSNEHIGYMVQVKSLLQQCFIQLIRNYENEIKSQEHFAPSHLSEQKYIIAEEYFLYEYKTLSLETLAGRLGLSGRQTNRFLKRCYGKNFQQKKAESKMSAAASLLLDHKLSATDIAFELGYSSLEHFLTAFKRYYGMSTRAYRQKNRPR